MNGQIQLPTKQRLVPNQILQSGSIVVSAIVDNYKSAFIREVNIAIDDVAINNVFKDYRILES